MLFWPSRKAYNYVPRDAHWCVFLLITAVKPQLKSNCEVSKHLTSRHSIIPWLSVFPCHLQLMGFSLERSGLLAGLNALTVSMAVANKNTKCYPNVYCWSEIVQIDLHYQPTYRLISDKRYVIRLAAVGHCSVGFRKSSCWIGPLPWYDGISNKGILPYKEQYIWYRGDWGVCVKLQLHTAMHF